MPRNKERATTEIQSTNPNRQSTNQIVMQYPTSSIHPVIPLCYAIVPIPILFGPVVPVGYDSRWILSPSDYLSLWYSGYNTDSRWILSPSDYLSLWYSGYNTGMALASSWKDFVCKVPETSQATVMAENFGGKQTKKLPDLNKEPPTDMDVEENIGNVNFSGSRTVRFDIEHSHVEQRQRQSRTLLPYPTSMWGKRRKLSPREDYGRGTQNFQTGESSFVPKGGEHYKKTTDCNKTSSKSASCGILGGEAEPMVLDKEPDLTEAVKERRRRDLFNNPWVKRLIPDAQMRSPTRVACEPVSSNKALDESETK